MVERIVPKPLPETNLPPLRQVGGCRFRRQLGEACRLLWPCEEART
jgi:hypothetical protein